MINTEKYTELKVSLSIDEIFKSVYANSAWRAMNSKDPVNYPDIITADRRPILRLMLKNAAVTLVKSLRAYISEYNINLVNNDMFTFDIYIPKDLPAVKMKLIYHEIEGILISDVLRQCYFTSAFDGSISKEYAEEVKQKYKSLKSTLNYQTHLINCLQQNPIF